MGEDAPLRTKMLASYGPFMASMVLAKNSEEWQLSLKLCVLPSGSYVEKRQAKFNISLNSFLGVNGESKEG